VEAGDGFGTDRGRRAQTDELVPSHNGINPITTQVPILICSGPTLGLWGCPERGKTDVVREVKRVLHAHLAFVVRLYARY